MKKYIVILCMMIASLATASAQRVIVTLGAPCVHTHYVEYHRHCVPPPPVRAPRYYYAPVEHHHHHHAEVHHHHPAPHSHRGQHGHR